MTGRTTAGVLAIASVTGAALLAPAGLAAAPEDRLVNAVAVFAALDKVTATIKKLEVKLNDTIEYGSLRVTPRACYSRPPTEQPKTTSFVEVDEVQLDGQTKRIFSGWMFAESPGLNAVEHPVFDVWLTDCQKPTNTVAARPPPRPAGEGDPATDTGPAPAAPPANDAYVPDDAYEPSDTYVPDDQYEPRRRVRR